MPILAGRFTLIVVAALLLDQAPDSRPVVPSDPGAERVQRMLDELEAREGQPDGGGRTYVLTESDLNAFLAAKIGERPRKDVESLRIEMKEALFTTFLRVDFDQVEVRGDSITRTLIKAVLRGKQTIEFDGRLQTDNGKGTYTVERATLNGIPLPPSLIHSVLSAVGRKQDPPFDPIEPFDLPYGIKTVVVSRGKATLET